MNDKPYWHELPQAEVGKLIEQKVTNQHVMDNYNQPAWCAYRDALCGAMGCWSLTDNELGGLRTKISIEFCTGCDCFKNK